MVLARLAAIDPGGQYSNRPLSSLQDLFCTWLPGTHAPYEARIAVLESLSKQNPQVSWDLIAKLLPESYEHRTQAPSPRFREAGASAREAMTYPLLHRTHSWLTEKACELAGSDPQRWVKLIGKLRAIPDLAREHLIQRLSGAVAGMTEEARSSIWRALSDLTRLHRTHSTADWVLPESELLRLDVIAEALLPKETGSRDEYLFRQQFPPFREMDAHRIPQQIEEWRSEAIRRILAVEGLEGMIRFAGRVEAAHFVGGSLGMVVSTPDILIEAIALSEAASLDLPGFAAAISGSARMRFGPEWTDKLRDAIHSGRVTQTLLVDLVLYWPHEPETWTWIASFGSDAENRYWKGKQAWGIAAEGLDLAYAVDMYLKNERPEYVLESLGPQADRLAGRQWLEVLEVYRVRVTSEPEAAKGQLAPYSIQYVFRFLQNSPDVPMEQLALLEYSYLPVLRPSWRDVDSNSALDKCLAQSPELFVKVLSDCFRKTAERESVKPDPSQEEASRAKNAFHLLESFGRVPGLVEGVLDADALKSWVSGVLDLASAADRLEIAEEYIGKLLARVSSDPEDSLWPHRAIRDGLEVWCSDRIETGFHVAVINGGGVTVRGSLEGGQQERNLAERWRGNAERVQRWPRTRLLFRRIADDYERQGQMHDLHVEQMRLHG